MATVTGVEIVRGMACIYIDGALALRVKKVHYGKLPLEVDQEIDLQTYEDRLSSIQFPEAWEAALNSLDRSARTGHELRESLKRRGFAGPCVDAVMERLTETGLIDDARYAERLAELQSAKPVGLYAFKRKLRAKGISDEDAGEALSAFDEDQQREACAAAARSLWRKYEALPPREGKAKLSQALARRGFGWDVIEHAVDQLFD